MKKSILILTALFVAFVSVPCFAAPSGHSSHAPAVRAANYGGGMHSPSHNINRAPMRVSASVRHDAGRPPMIGPGIGHRPIAGRPPIHHVAVRPMPAPIYRPYRPMPVYRPYYSSFYYPTTSYYSSYTYYPYSNYVYDGTETILPVTNTVVVRDNYAGINTAANVINAAANVASTIRYLTW